MSGSSGFACPVPPGLLPLTQLPPATWRAAVAPSRLSSLQGTHGRVSAQLDCRPCTQPRQVTWPWGPAAPPISSPLLSGRSLHPADLDERAGPPPLSVPSRPALPPLSFSSAASLAPSLPSRCCCALLWASFLEAVGLPGPFPLHLAVNRLRSGPGSCSSWRCLDAGLGYTGAGWVGAAAGDGGWHR